MKRLLNILFLFFVSFILILNVNAGAGFDGAGVSSGSTGKTHIGGVDGNYTFLKSNMLKLTLVEILDDGDLKSYVSGYILNNSQYYSDNALIDLGHQFHYTNLFNNEWTTSKPGNISGKQAIYGFISGAPYEYLYNAYGGGNYVNIEVDNEYIEPIIPSSQVYLNFNVNKLAESIIANWSTCKELSSGVECVITPQYAEIVLSFIRNSPSLVAQLSTLGIDINSVSDFSEIDPNLLFVLNKFRIIIEPIYSMKLNGSTTKYIFSTPKAIAKKVIDSGLSSNDIVFGVLGSELAKNAYASSNVGKINETELKFGSTAQERWEKLADPYNGLGYVIVQLSYAPVTNSCEFYKEGETVVTPTPEYIPEEDETDLEEVPTIDLNKMFYYDSLGMSKPLGTDGIAFESFLNDCSCDIFEESPYFDELLTDPIISTLYNNNCMVPTSCTYSFDSTTSLYSYYNVEGELVYNYEDFISSCGCDADDVKTLSLSDGAFSTIYESVCSPILTDTYTSDLRVCSADDNDYSLGHDKLITFDDNTYCNVQCTEDVKLENLVTETYLDNTVFTAGKYYSLPGMREDDVDKLSITGTKKCTTTIDYDKWLRQYNSLVRNLTSRYNRYMGYGGEDSYGGCDCEYYDCGKEGEKTRMRCSCSYDSKRYEGSDILLIQDDGERSSSRSYCSYDPEDRFDSANTSAQNQYYAALNKLNKHINYLKSCNNQLVLNKEENIDFYKFQSDLEYRYEQNYSTKGIVWNNERKSKIKDINETDEKLSKYVTDYGITSTNLEDGITPETTIDVKDYTPTDSNNYMINVDEEESIKERGNFGPYKYERQVQYKFYYRPSIDKYVDPLNGRIADSTTSSSFLNTPIKLGYVYDLDISAIPGTNNAYYLVTALGDNNEIYNHFNSTDNTKLRRSCDYNIGNEVICEDLALCVTYRNVDSNNIDPNDRLNSSNDGFNNWRNVKGEAVKNEMENTDTFHPDNIEYSFTLDAISITKIRNFSNGCNSSNDCDENARKDYDDINNNILKLTCNSEGNECISAFITELTDEDGEFGLVATNTEGRKRWKYLKYNNINNKWYIDVMESMGSYEYDSLLKSATYIDKGVTP